MVLKRLSSSELNQSRRSSYAPSETSTSSLDNERFTLDLSIAARHYSKKELRKKFVKDCFLSVLTYCIDELSLLTSVYAPFVEKFEINDLNYRTLEDRFANVKENFEDFIINSKYTNMHKLQKDLSLLIYLIKLLIQEVRCTESFLNVTTCMQSIENMHKDEENLFQELQKKNHLFKYMRWTSVKEKQAIMSVGNMYNNSIKDTIATYQDQAEYSRIEVQYAQNWQNARHEQNQLQLNLKESGYTSTSNNMLRQIDLEKQCHEQLETYIAESQKDYTDKIQYWMNRYDSDLETRENDIYNLKIDIEKLGDKHDILKAEYEIRAQAIEDWLEQKRKKKEEDEFIALVNWAATKIQAWWRGVMVIKKLGPYRKRKTKKDKKGKKDTKSRNI